MAHSDSVTLPGKNQKIATEEREGEHYQKILTDIPLTAFGHVTTAEDTPQVQVKFDYGISSENAQVLTNKSGSSVTVVDSNCVVTAEGVPNSFSQIRSLDFVRYGPGQGAKGIGTCIFDTPQANSSQVFGEGDDDEGFFFGYDELVFGCLHRSFGSLEIKVLEITGAASGTDDITITVDGTAVTVAITSGDTIAEITEKIVGEAAEFFNAGRGWETLTRDNISVEFVSLVAENALGTFSFAAGSTGVTAGAFVETLAGAVPTEDWIPQTTWNQDKMNGSGPSKITLDPTKGNVYETPFEYLGYGPAFFGIGKNRKDINPVHILEYSNANTRPILSVPSLAMTGIVKTETGYSGPDLTIKSGSLAGFIQGKETELGLHKSVSATKSIGTTETPILILHNVLVFNGKRNKINADALTASVSTESTKPVELKLYVAPSRIDGGVALTDVDTGVSVLQSGSTGTAHAGGSRAQTIEFTASRDSNLRGILPPIRPGERWLVTARVTSGSASNVTVSLNMLERQ